MSQVVDFSIVIKWTALDEMFQGSPFFQNYEINLQEEVLGDGSYSICR